MGENDNTRRGDEENVLPMALKERGNAQKPSVFDKEATTE